MPKVYIVGGGYSVERLFQKFGWDVTKQFHEADLIQFTGGGDISPDLYCEAKHPTTHPHVERDKYEKVFYDRAIEHNKAMAGICRGGQLMNVLNGGKMWQDIDGHAGYGGHTAIDFQTGDVFTVSSLHHQEMIPGNNAEILLIAHEATQKERMLAESRIMVHVPTSRDYDVEALVYPGTKSFCFQGHPEFNIDAEVSKRYMGYIKTSLGLAA